MEITKKKDKVIPIILSVKELIILNKILNNVCKNTRYDEKIDKFIIDSYENNFSFPTEMSIQLSLKNMINIRANNLEKFLL